MCQHGLMHASHAAAALLQIILETPGIAVKEGDVSGSSFLPVVAGR